MFKFGLKIVVLLLAIVFCIGLLQTTAAAQAENDEEADTSSEIPVPDGGFTIVLRAPMDEYPQLVKVYKVDSGNTKDLIPGWTVSLPRDTPVFFMVDDVDTTCYSVKITVNSEKSLEPSTRDTKVRLLKEEIIYECVIALKETKEFKRRFTVTLKEKKSGLYGTKATLGPFLTDLKDENYVKVDTKIVLGLRDQVDKSLGVLLHVPIYSRDCKKIRWAFALSSGLALGKLTTSDGSLSIGPTPTTLGVSFLLAGRNTDSLLAVSAGGILKPVKRLNGYSIGDGYPDESNDLTKSVNELGFFVAVTFSYDILNRVGFKSNSSNQN